MDVDKDWRTGKSSTDRFTRTIGHLCCIRPMPRSGPQGALARALNRPKFHCIQTGRDPGKNGDNNKL